MVNDGGFPPSLKATKLRQILKKELGYQRVPPRVATEATAYSWRTEDRASCGRSTTT